MTPVFDQALGTAEFMALFGVESLPPECAAAIGRYDFRYAPISALDRERLLYEVLTAIDRGDFTLAGPAAKARWEKGWGENLERLKAREAGALVPKYIRPNRPIRLFGEYVQPFDPDFELHWYDVFQEWLFRTYFKEAKIVYEFGCGSGINLERLATMYPDKRYVGLDWVQASADIANELGRQHGWDMEGRVFDFFWPDESLEIEEGAVVFTLASLEQTGAWWAPFLGHLLRFRPALCVFIEPIVEWYTNKTLVDYAAVRFHKARGYLEGLEPRLQQRKREGRVEILKAQRSNFGSLYLEGYSQLVWKPL